MIAAGVVVLQVLCCLGLGAATMRALGVDGGLAFGERCAFAFALGFGVLGWLLFFLGAAGLFDPGPMLALLSAGAIASVWLRPRGGRVSSVPPRAAIGAVGWGLVAAIAAVLACDAAEALAPPADADSLAYHFALPKTFVAAGGLEFVPRAIEGAIPLLVQTTYVPALALGGEAGLTLWTMASGWAAAGLVFVLARRHLDATWSLALALVLLSTPAVLFGAGSGQVEVRMALFALVGAAALATAITDGSPRHGAVAGLAAGFLMASKYTGLFFVAAAGIVALTGRRRLAVGAAFGLAAALAGAQWYAWNWLHTGDPVFPMLYGLVPYRDPTLWDPAHQALLRTVLDEWETAVPRDGLGIFVYPFLVLLTDPPKLGAGRTGLGPFALLALPMAMAALWTFRRRLASSPLMPVAAVVVLFYVLWFAAGSPQKVRHLLPVYPLALVCIGVAAHRWSAEAGALRPLALAVVLTGAIQIAGQAAFTAQHWRHHVSGEDRGAFLARNLAGYDAAQWINAHLGPTHRVLHVSRWLNYVIDVPVLYVGVGEARVDVALAASEPGAVFRQMRGDGVTHVLAAVAPADEPADAGWEIRLPRWAPMIQRRCLRELAVFEDGWTRSRTFPALGGFPLRFHVLALEGTACGD